MIRCAFSKKSACLNPFRGKLSAVGAMPQIIGYPAGAQLVGEEMLQFRRPGRDVEQILEVFIPVGVPGERLAAQSEDAAVEDVKFVKDGIQYLDRELRKPEPVTSGGPRTNFSVFEHLRGRLQFCRRRAERGRDVQRRGTS